jgi:hypothetical protein
MTVKKETLVNADDLWQIAWTYIRTVVDTLREPFLVLDEDLRVISANKTALSNLLKSRQGEIPATLRGLTERSQTV